MHATYKTVLILLLQSPWLAGCGTETAPSALEGKEVHAEKEDAHAEEEQVRGPHGGRVLTDGGFRVELAIFESGVPPEFRAWILQDGQPVDLASVNLVVELTRLGNTVERIDFAPAGEFLRGNQEIVEPHSFAVSITATRGDRTHGWSYESYEGRTTIAAEAARIAGIATDTAGPGVISESIQLYGSIVPDATRVREVRARFPGVIRSVNGQVGDRVRTGDVLATVESDESLQTFPVTAPLAGVITERHAETGEQTDAAALFEIADFSRVWGEFSVFSRDRARLRAGQTVTVLAEGGGDAVGTLSYLSPVGNRSSQSVIARVVLDNPSGRWTPGQFVEARVTVAESPVEIAVPLSALQSFRDSTVVFAQVGETYEVRMLELGRRDTTRVEVLQGLAPGTVYVTGNSYLVKADIEKSGASHDH